MALGTGILMPFRDMFRLILASVHMVMVRVCTLFIVADIWLLEKKTF